MNVKEYKSIVGANFTPKKRIKHEEDNLQAKVCSYLSKFDNVVYWSTPNGIYIKNNNTKKVFRNTGMVAGAPDLTVCINGGIVLFFELKKPESKKISPKTGKMIIASAKGRQSTEQKIMENKLKELSHKYFVVTSLGEIIEILKQNGFEFKLKGIFKIINQ